MYLQLPPLALPPGAKPGTPAPTIADALAQVLRTETKPAGFGEYDRMNYSWEFYPPPYQFARGMGCAGGKCSCGGACKSSGMGLFESGLNFTGWGIGEWLIVGLGLYVGYSLFKDSQRAARGVRRAVKRRRVTRRPRPGETMLYAPK